MESGYSFMRIGTFLQDTKGVRSVKVERFFPNLKLFHDSVRLFMKNTESIGQLTLTDQESFRLKKLMQKVRAQIADNE